MSHLSHEPASDPTVLTPVLFRDGLDRRLSARIPLSTRVRVGPPGGLPESVVSASDLSLGGLFVDADREVRVGARFSVEIPLSDGERIYIPEAEVAYNRCRAAGSGFGVRFVDLEPEAAAAIEATIDAATTPRQLDTPTEVLSRKDFGWKEARSSRPKPPSLSTLPTIVPTIDIDVSDYPEPILVDDDLILDSPDIASEMPARPPGPGALTVVFTKWRGAVREARHNVRERTNRTPKFYGGIAIVGATCLAAAFCVTLWTGAHAEAVEPITIASPVPATTHQVLMGKASVDAMGSPVDEPADNAVEPTTKTRRQLPPLVVVDPPAAKPAESKPAPVSEPTEPVVKQTSKPSAKQAARPAVAKSVDGVSSAAKAILGDTSDRVVLSVDASSSVLKTHVYSSPPRFVVDLVDQRCPVNAPAVGGAIKGVRSGQHPDYCRIVVDSSRPIEAGRFEKKGERLVLHLHY